MARRSTCSMDCAPRSPPIGPTSIGRSQFLSTGTTANAQLLGIKAFSETDFTEDLRSIDVPVLILHGEDDQIVPVVNGRNTAALVKRPTLKTYPGLPHGMATTHADRINADILGFIRA